MEFNAVGDVHRRYM